MLLPLVTLALVWVLYRWAVDSFPALSRRRGAVAVALAIPWLAQVVARFMIGRRYDSTVPRTVAELVLLPLAMAALPIGAVRLASWAWAKWAEREKRARRPSRGAAEPADRPGMTRRQAIEATSGVAILGATGSMLGWGIVRGRHEFELREVPVRLEGLPRALDGYVIAQISDVHAGTYVGERELAEGLSVVRRARPDLVVVTGDTVDFDADRARAVVRRLADLGVRDGVAAVLGNHEYYADVDDFAAIMRAGGVDLLVDEGRVVRGADGGGFALLGVDDRWSRRYGRPGPRLDRALSMVPADRPRVLLSHQPITVDAWAGRVALQLSGHTHGGQIDPGFCPARLLLRYVHGRYDVRGTTLYVNRGFGTVGVPARVGARPEVTRVVLVAA